MRFSRSIVFFLAAAPLLLAAEWKDPAPHTVQFVTVAPDIELEVLDWGGSGRAVLLLAGSGNNAHIFDDIAPKLSGCCHVYAMTRRGYGLSSHPDPATAGNYSDQRLADDVLAVIDALHLKMPVVAGHSMGGGEVTTLGAQHSDRLGGLVYLDALGDPGDFPAASPAYMALYRKLPAEKPPTPPTGDDRKTFQAWRDFQKRDGNPPFPEAELRNGYEENPDGSMGRYRSTSAIHNAVGDGGKKRDYSHIRVPVLNLIGIPAPVTGDVGGPEGTAARNAFRDATIVYIKRWEANLHRDVPDARTVEMVGANHYIFLSNEAEVVSEMKAFVAKLR